MDDVVDMVETLVGTPWGAAVAVVAVAAVLAALAGLLRRGPRPVPGEVWFAEVPFEDRPGSKDRPVLVLAVTGRTCSVAAFTSQDRSACRDHARVPDGVTGLAKASWVRLRTTTLRRSAFRRRVSSHGPAIVVWYEGAAARQQAPRAR